ncbi:MAG: DJ-1 family protein [Planctomycetota bacterium]|nr:MAG: DJ-1 family protein [Planctomycetota bacterium]
MSKTLVFLANGFEEIETVTIIDLLRRAQIEVITASIHNHISVKGAHNISIEADVLLENINESDSYDLMVLPGGLPGADYLNESLDVEKLILNQHSQKKFIGAICAAPKVLCSKGIVENINITHYPDCIENLNGAIYINENVVHDGNIITSKGPSTAIEFSLKLIALLNSELSADEIANQILIKN